MNINVEKLYKFFDSTSFLYRGDILELIDNIMETGETKVEWRGKIYDLSANGSIENLAEIKQQAVTKVLNEITTEIEQIEINGHIRDVECFEAGINSVLNIIDKHKKSKE